MKADPRTERILNQIQSYRNSEYRTRTKPEGKGDALDSVIEALNGLGEDLDKNISRQDSDQKRLESIMDILLQYTVLDFSKKAKISGYRDVIDAIAAGLNYLGEEIEEAISRNERYSRDLEVKAAQLETSNKELESFSYSVSHDLRSPLRAIHGYSQILLEDHQNELTGESKRLIDTIMSNALKMGKLIDDLLDYSRLERKEFRKSKIDLKKLVKGIIKQINEPGKDRAEFIVGDLPEIEGDLTMMSQAYINLISNAVKYSSKKDRPQIEIGVKDDGGRKVFFVRDNGVGFDMNHYDKLFNVFQRLHHENEFTGTGVGLPIVQRVIKRHDGKVWAEGELGHGTTFYFTFHTEKDGL